MRRFLINVNGNSYEVEVEELTGAASAPSNRTASTAVPVCDPAASSITAQTPAREAASALQEAPGNIQTPAGASEVKSPLPGIILGINVSVGDTVSEGDVLVVIEAMKMENEIMAPKSGTILSIAAARDMTVNTGDLLLVIG